MKKLHETIRNNVDSETGSLPSQTLQGVITDVKEVQQSSDPGGRETVSSKAQFRAVDRKLK